MIGGVMNTLPISWLIPKTLFESDEMKSRHPSDCLEHEGQPPPPKKPLNALVVASANDDVLPEAIIAHQQRLINLLFAANRLLQEDLFRQERDQLTGALTRNAFEIRAKEKIALWDARQLAVVFVDVDGLKLVNDTVGHRAGDEILKALAATVFAHVRANDLFGRIGGDEFALVLEGMGKEDATRLVERLSHAYENKSPEYSFNRGKNPRDWIRPCFSVGIAVIGADGAAYDEVLRVADQRMYVEKDRRKRERRLCAERRGGFSVWPPHNAQHHFLLEDKSQHDDND